MKRDELCSKLRKQYKPGDAGGVAKVDDPAYKNLWFVVPPPPPETLPVDLPTKIIARANQVLEHLPTTSMMDPLDRLISLLFVRREAVTSSRMEGTWSTIDHVLTPGDILGEPGESARSERASVIGYAEALEEAFEEVRTKGVKILTVAKIRRLHKAVLSKDPNFFGKPGQLRAPGTSQAIVQIGGLGRKEESVFNPAPPDQVKRCLEETMAWHQNDIIVEMGDAGMGMPLPVRMALGHAHFEAVHPFPDGNGRIGRMLWPLQMVAADKMPIYLSGYVEANREAYSYTLQDAQKHLHYGPIVEFLCEALIAAAQEASTTRQALEHLPTQWRERSRFRKNSSADRILEHLIGAPIVTTRHMSQVLKVTFKAANSAIDQLCKKNILRERTGYERNRVFAAEEVISLLSREFGEDPDKALVRGRKFLRQI